MFGQVLIEGPILPSAYFIHSESGLCAVSLRYEVVQLKYDSPHRNIALVVPLLDFTSYLDHCREVPGGQER